MYFPHFVGGMVSTLCAVATWAYAATASFWLACCRAIVTAAILQAGYFFLILGLVLRNRSGNKAIEDTGEPVSELRS